MRRALVISILFHLLILASLFEFRLVSSKSSLFARAEAPLLVDFNSAQVLRGLVPDQQGNAKIMTGAKLRPGAEPRSASTGVRTSSRVLAQRDSRIERSRLPTVDQTEHLSGLPADLESEYRLGIAHELRRAGYLSAGTEVGRREGFVRLVISYRVGMPVAAVSLDRSSGNPELDAAAMADLSGAVGIVRLPSAATGVNFRMSFVLDYGPARLSN